MQYDPTQRYRGMFGGGSQGYQTPQNLEVAKPDGTVEHWTQAFNKRTGQSVFTNESTGAQQGTRPDGAYDPAQTPQKEIMEQPQKDAAAFGSQSTQLDKMADNANQVLSFLPYVRPGASMPAMAARDLSQITGMPVMGNDPSAQQAMSAALDQLRTNALQQDRGLGALRMPEINEAMKSTLNLSQNPQAIHYLAAETQNKAEPVDIRPCILPSLTQCLGPVAQDVQHVANHPVPLTGAHGGKAWRTVRIFAVDFLRSILTSGCTGNLLPCFQRLSGCVVFLSPCKGPFRFPVAM